MAFSEMALLAGSVSTFIFVGSYLPMLVKAARSKDLSSYSPWNLVLANVGNLVHSVYIFSLPAGPLWALHGFYLVATALMFVWWIRYGRRPGAFRLLRSARAAEPAPATESRFASRASAAEAERVAA